MACLDRRKHADKACHVTLLDKTGATRLEGPRGERAPGAPGVGTNGQRSARKEGGPKCVLLDTVVKMGQKQGDGFQPRKGLWEDGTVGRSVELDPGLGWFIPTRENKSSGGELGSSPLTSKIQPLVGRQR